MKRDRLGKHDDTQKHKQKNNPIFLKGESCFSDCAGDYWLFFLTVPLSCLDCTNCLFIDYDVL